MKFDLSILATAAALVGSATAAPQNSNNNGNWQSYPSKFLLAISQPYRNRRLVFVGQCRLVVLVQRQP
jgi:hypothetical protein